VTDDQRTVGQFSGETSDRQMGVVGAIVAGGVVVLFLPFLPVVALLYLLRRLRS
jgi:hypothetical protein